MSHRSTPQISLAFLRQQIIGRDYRFRTPFGERLMTYADYIASGRNLRFVEEYLLSIQESYANTHTEDDLTGKSTTELLHQAESLIKRSVNSDDSTCLIAVGAGSTAAICRFQEVLGVGIPPATWDRLLGILTAYLEAQPSSTGGSSVKPERQLLEFLSQKRPVVFVGPYEHHSNEVSWRECLVETVEIDLAEDGQLDLEDLRSKVSDSQYDGRLKIGSFSAASNVTGLLTPVYEVAQILHQYGALACFDFAGSAPYVDIDMNRDETSYFDAIFISPHKFLGGPGSSGVLLFRDQLYRRDLPPTCGGGGTVDYVGPEGHDYTSDIEAREKAGTPGTYQVMRAALAMELKERIGTEQIELREREFIRSAMRRFSAHPSLEVLGNPDPEKRLAIVSFNVRHGDRYLHPKLATRLLNDLFGIQSRAGCSCAGPYGHRLLGIGSALSRRYREQIQEGYQGIKPGWVRVGFHYTMTAEEVEFICRAVEFLGAHGFRFIPLYSFDLKTGTWSHTRDSDWQTASFGIDSAYQQPPISSPQLDEAERNREYERYLEQAAAVARQLEAGPDVQYHELPGVLEELSYFQTVHFA